MNEPSKIFKHFPLGHTTLYCKNWYAVSDNPFKDLRKTLSADGYSAEYFSDKDIIFMLLGKIDEYFDLFKHANNSLGIRDLYDHLSRFDGLYPGYKDKPIEYKICVWICGRIAELWKEDFVDTTPDYNVLPKGRWYNEAWVNFKLYPIFVSHVFSYEWNDDAKIFRKRVAPKAMKKAVKELCKKYDDLLSEYGGKERNVVELFKDVFAEQFIVNHKNLFS